MRYLGAFFQRGGLLSVFVVLHCVSGCFGFGGPFETNYTITLGALTQTGDLDLRVDVIKQRLADLGGVRVQLVHELYDGDYKSIRSGFNLRPFVTCITHTSKDQITWLAPSGGVYKFDKGNSYRARLPQYSKLIVSRYTKSDNDFYCIDESKSVQLYTTESEDVYLILDHGWLLCYVSCSLNLIVTPDQKTYDVESIGRRVQKIYDQEGELLEVHWNKDNMPGEVVIGKQLAAFDYDNAGQLVSVSTGEGKLVAKFRYDDRRLLVGYSPEQGIEKLVNWEKVENSERGDCTYRFCYKLAAFDGSSYSFRREDGKISLSRMNEDKHLSEVFINTEFGRLVGVRQRE